MNVKTITNEYHTELRKVICDFCGDIHAAERCESSLRDASLDDNSKDDVQYVYSFPDCTPTISDMTVIKLDKFSQLFMKKRGFNGCPPSAVDAVCVNHDNQWFLIEFKNQDISKSSVQKEVKKKMLSSLWLLFHSYSETKCTKSDAVSFAKNNVHFIVVCSRDKNCTNGEAGRIQKAETTQRHYTPRWLAPYVGYYFKELFVLTENELRIFVSKFS